jgi:hypothetical protein
LQQLIDGGDPVAIMPSVATAAGEAGLTAAEQTDLRSAALRAWARSAISDDLITPQEYERMGVLTSALGVDTDSIAASDRALYEQLFIATVNAGYLPEVSTPKLLAKKGEIVHIEWPASLMKEVAIREYQGGYRGVSIPIGKTGIRYKVGGSRGQSVQVGTMLDVADSGTIAVTNKRAVYMGSRKTVEMPYAKLINLTVYSDGVQAHLSNRVNAPLFSVPYGSEILAAVIMAASQKAESA